MWCRLGIDGVSVVCERQKSHYHWVIKIDESFSTVAVITRLGVCICFIYSSFGMTEFPCLLFNVQCYRQREGSTKIEKGGGVYQHDLNC